MTPRPTSSPGDRYGYGRVFTLISLLLVFATLLAACGTTSNTNTSKYGGTLTVVPGPLGVFTRNFNVFANGSVLSGTQGLVYETLLFFNREERSVKPWLSSRYPCSSSSRHSSTISNAILITGNRLSRTSTKYATLPSTQIRALTCCSHKAR